MVGRLKPQGSDADLQKYGDLIADRMMSYGLPESSAAARAALDEKYKHLLALFEAHLIQYPYFLGGHPSAADYAVMGAFHAHMGRDPRWTAGYARPWSEGVSVGRKYAFA